MKKVKSGALVFGTILGILVNVPILHLQMNDYGPTTFSVMESIREDIVMKDFQTPAIIRGNITGEWRTGM